MLRITPGIVSILLLCGCMGCGSPPSEPDNSLTIGIQSDPTSLDPRLATDAISSRVIDLIFNGLFRNDENGRPVPDLVERYEIQKGTDYLITLRQGVKFHNGAELCASDVEFTIESILDPELGSRKRASFKNVESIEARDAYTLLIRLREPQASFVETLKIGIVPGVYAKRLGEQFASQPVGTGPFRLADWSKGSRLKLERNEAYFRGTPPIKAIACKVVPETSTRLLELRKGSVDFVQNDIPPESVRSFSEEGDFTVQMAPSSTYKYIGINLKHPILSRLPVRRAMAYAIDRKAIVEHLLLGQATLASGLLAPSNPFYEPDVEKYDFDPNRAKQLLDEAGLRLNAEKGHRFVITFKTSKDLRANQIAQIIQQQLEEVGIRVEIKSFEWATFYSDILAGNFDIYSLTWVGISDPDFFFDVFNSISAPPNGVNRGHYGNAEVDELTQRGKQELDFDKRREICSRVQKIIGEELPYISLWHPHNVAIMDKRLTGFHLYPAGDFKSFETAKLAAGQ